MILSAAQGQDDGTVLARAEMVLWQPPRPGASRRLIRFTNSQTTYQRDLIDTGPDRYRPSRPGRALFALLLGAGKRLAQPLERELVGALGAAARGALDGEVRALAHGVDHAGLF